MKSTRIRLKIDREKLAWLKFVMESYEGLALTTTLDGASGQVLVSIAPGAERETAELLASLETDLGLVTGREQIDDLLNRA